MFPFPESKQAFKRMDYCGDMTCNKPDAFSCFMGAKQCGAHIANIQDPAVSDNATAALLRRAQALGLSGWLGNGSEFAVGAEGGCATLLTDEPFQKGFWDEFGQETVKNSSEAVENALAQQPLPSPLAPKQHCLKVPEYGSRDFMALNYLRATQGSL